MFTDPENYNRDTQRESERDFLPFEESFNKNQNKNNYKIIQNNPNNPPSFGPTNINNSQNPNIKINPNSNNQNNQNENNENYNNNNNNTFAEAIMNKLDKDINENWYDKLKCNISFLQKYFDIDTEEIKERLISSLIPLNSRFYNLIEKKPDLYGPFWIFTTLIFVISASGSMTKYLQGITNEDYFQQFIPKAAYIIYGIGFCLPIIIYVVMYFFGSNTPFILILCTYSYSFSIYIPIMILCIPIEKLQWILLFIGVLQSTGFLLINLWKEIDKFVDNRKYFVLGIICIFQICLFLLLKLKFFKHINKSLITYN
jgi:hypothetical protein